MVALNAKIRAMRSRLLTSDRYRILCQAQSIEHFIAQTQNLSSIEEELERMRLFSGYQLSIFGINDLNWKLNNKQNKLAFAYIKGTEIDLYNILQIYRLKKYYPTTEIYPYIVPSFYRLSRDNIKQMAQSAGVPEFLVAVKHTLYNYITFENAEQEISKILAKTYSKAAKRYPSSLASTWGYFFAKQTEAQNLASIAEGLRYKLPPGEIYKHMRIL